MAPRVEPRLFLVMAGDHGVAVEGVSAFPQEVTGEMVKNFLAGGASINALAREAGAEVWVADLGIIPDMAPQTASGQHFIERKVGRGTANLATGPAMSRAQAQQAILTGFELASEAMSQGVQMLGTGDMGIANTTPSTAIAAALTGRPLTGLVGRGTGLDDPGLANKRRVIERGLELNRPDPNDGLDVLAKVGGFEIGGIAGCVLAAAYHRKPVVIDGLISTAGALIAHALCPAVARLHLRGPPLPGAGPRRPCLSPLGPGAYLGPGHALGRGHRRGPGHAGVERGGPGDARGAHL